ncbi:MAG TPA: tetratricopeptide repeat protein [Chitinophagales bacterium]|nr:tetratricopeptide repeat protein [Chitinophagales bacterium]
MKLIPLILLLVPVLYGKTTGQAVPSAENYLLKAESFKKADASDSTVYYYRKAATLYEQQQPDLYVNTLNELGKWLTRKDELEQATEVLERSIQFSKQQTGVKPVTTATTFLAMGVVENAKGNYTRSISLHQQALDIRLKELGKYNSEVASSYGNMGNVFFNSGDFDSAITYHTEALQIRQQLYGAGAPELAQSYNNLGNAYREKKQYATALENFQKAAQIREQPPVNNKDLAKYYKSISEVYFLMGDREKGEQFKIKADGVSQ